MKSLSWKLLFLFLALFSYTAVSATVEDNIAYADLMAKKYGVSAVQLKATLKGESGFRMYNPKTGEILRGAAGEYGIGQFMPGTWKWMEGMFLKEHGRDLSMYNTQHQIEMVAYAFSKNLQSHWVAWRLVYARHTLPKSFLMSL